MSGMNIVDTNSLPLAARVAARGCLLAMSSLQSSASSISLNRGTAETELLERAASPTLDTEIGATGSRHWALERDERLRYP